MDKRKIKILFLINQLLPGGTEKQLIVLADSLRRDRFDPVIGVLEGNNYISSLKIKTPIVIFDWSGPLLLKNVSLIWKLRRYLAIETFDIVQTHFSESEIHGFLAARLNRRQPVLISTRRNFYHWIKEEPWNFRISKRIVRWSDRVLTNSYKVFEKCQEVEGISQEKIVVLQNGVDISKFNTISSGEAKRIVGLEGALPVIGVVGNWRPVKGFASFLKASALILREIQNAHFVLVGFGLQENKLRSLAHDLGIYHRVTFLGSHTDIPTIMAAFDVAVQPSLSESFSNALLEYMAAVKPIVATKVGDAEMVIKHEESGLLIEPENPEELADAVIYLCRQKKEAAHMGQRARERAAANWSMEKVVGKYELFYQSLVEL